MSFEVNSRESQGVVVLDANGRLTLGSGGTDLRELLHSLAEQGHKRFLFNLAGVEFIDSYGIGELVRCHVAVRQMQGELKLVHLTKRVRDLLELTRLDHLFEIHSDEQAALARFS